MKSKAFKKDCIVVFNGLSCWTENKGYNPGFFEEIVFKGTLQECKQWAENLTEKTPGLIPKNSLS